MALDWDRLLQTGFEIGSNIYTAQVQKRAERQEARAAKSQSKDFPQLGMGLAATGPQRNPFGLVMTAFDVQSGGSSTAPMANGQSSIVPRGPIYTTVSTPSGGTRVIGMRSMGTPLLWSGDFAAVRRVARVARKLGRFIRHRPR